MEMMQGSFNWVMVGLSYLISVFGAFTALQLAVGIPTSRGAAMVGWLVAAATAMGGGAIWSMHFIGMLAYRMPMEVAYDKGLTFLSLIIAIAAAVLGLFVVGRGAPSFGKLVLGGVFCGIGVAGMHYTGMAAMRMPATVTYDPTLFVASIAIAIVASMAALWLAFNLRGHMQRFGSAFVMGAAVCGMHYTGMAAAQIMPETGARQILSSAVTDLGPEGLGLSIFCVTLVLLTVALLVGLSRNKVEPVYEIEV